MSLKDKLKIINNIELKNSILPKDYVINKNVFRVTLIICSLLLLSILISYDFDFSPKYTLSCPIDSPTVCINPFYEADQDFMRSCPDKKLCSIPFLNAGETYGEEFPPVVRQFGTIIILLWSLAIIFNHIIFNRGGEK